MVEPSMDRPPGRPLRRPSRTPLVALAALVLAAAGLGILWMRQGQRQQAAAPAAAGPQGPTAAAGPAGAVAVDAARVKALLEAVSPHAAFRAWLAEGDLLRRWAVVTDNLAEGVSPRKQLAFLAPAGPFAVVRSSGRAVIAPESYRRYDRFAEAVASVDAARLAAAYRELHPALEAAWRALGYPDGSLDKVTARALQRIALAPVAEGEVAVVEARGTTWAFADPRREAQGEVEKHLLRAGPGNTRLLQAKADELLQALGLGAAVQAAPGAPPAPGPSR